jgi:hypothetical protein
MRAAQPQAVTVIVTMIVVMVVTVVVVAVVIMVAVIMVMSVAVRGAMPVMIMMLAHRSPLCGPRVFAPRLGGRARLTGQD